MTRGDPCTTRLNFETLRPLRDVLEDYKRVLGRILMSQIHRLSGRLERFASLLNRGLQHLPEGDVRGRTSVLELMHRVVTALRDPRPFWRVFTACARDSAVRIVVAFMVLYLHLRPFSRLVIAAIDRGIAELDGQAPPLKGSWGVPSRVGKPCHPVVVRPGPGCR